MRTDDDVTIKLSPQKLAELFRLGVLCASEINCVDMHGRDLVHQLCLQACAHRLNPACSDCDALCNKGCASVQTSQTALIGWPIKTEFKAKSIH